MYSCCIGFLIRWRCSLYALNIWLLNGSQYNVVGPLDSIGHCIFTVGKVSNTFNTCWTCWWASSSDTLIYPSIFAFPSLSLHRWSTTMHLCSDTIARQSHSLYRTDLTYLMDIWLMIHMYLLLFLASPMCPLLRSDQSQVLAPCGQALSIASPYARILVYHSYLTSLYLPFTRTIITESLTICLYESPPELRFCAYASHLFCTILHYFASHCIALPRSHRLYQPQYTLRQSLTPRSHPLRPP